MRARPAACALVMMLPLLGCSGSKHDCKAFADQEYRLTYARDSLDPGSPDYRQAALTVAEFEVQDQTGCASAVDKAKAQADLDDLRNPQ